MYVLYFCFALFSSLVAYLYITTLAGLSQGGNQSNRKPLVSTFFLSCLRADSQYASPYAVQAPFGSRRPQPLAGWARFGISPPDRMGFRASPLSPLALDVLSPFQFLRFHLRLRFEYPLSEPLLIDYGAARLSPAAQRVRFSLSPLAHFCS